MSVHEPTPFRANIPSVDADRAVKFGVGVAAAPLWATFFTAAGAGLAYWWLTAAWTRREPKSFAPAASGAEPTLRAAEPAPRQPAPAAAAEPAPAPELASAPPPAPEPAPVVEVHPRPQPVAPGMLAASAPVAAGLEPVVEPTDIAAAIEHPKPAQAASRADGGKAEAPTAGPRKPPVKRKPEPKA